MVKKQILLLTAAAVLLLTSCKSVTSDNGQATAAKKTQTEEQQTVENFEEAYGRIGEADTHLTLDLNEKVHVDADVTEYAAYEAGAGVYDYALISDGDAAVVENTADILNQLNTYYGAEVLKENDLLGNSGTAFSFSREEKLSSVGHLESLCYRLPVSRMEEDAVLKEKTDEVLNIFKDIIGFSICTKYEYSHITEAVYKQSDQTDAVTGAKIDLSGLDNEEYYCVTIRPALGQNIPVISLGISPEVQEGQKLPDNVISRYGTIDLYDTTYCSLVFDKDKNLLSFEVFQGINMEQTPSQQVKILSGKSMLEVLHEHYKTADKKTEIVDLKLCYAAWDNGTDENGIEKYQLIPVWQVNTVVEGTGWAQKEFYNALTGEYIGFN